MSARPGMISEQHTRMWLPQACVSKTRRRMSRARAPTLHAAGVMHCNNTAPDLTAALVQLRTVRENPRTRAVASEFGTTATMRFASRSGNSGSITSPAAAIETSTTSHDSSFSHPMGHSHRFLVGLREKTGSFDAGESDGSSRRG